MENDSIIVQCYILVLELLFQFYFIFYVSCRTRPITSSSLQPSPRPRPRVSTGYSSNEISPASSCRKLSADSAELSFHRSSNSIYSTPRKKKPAPPPPPLQTNANHSVNRFCSFFLRFTFIWKFLYHFM